MTITNNKRFKHRTYKTFKEFKDNYPMLTERVRLWLAGMGLEQCQRCGDGISHEGMKEHLDWCMG